MSDSQEFVNKLNARIGKGGGIQPPQPAEVVVNLNIDDVVDYANIHTYEDCESHIITLAQSRDRNAFAIGDTLRAFEVNRGAPLDADATLTKLASRMGVLPSQLSMWRAVSVFFPPESRVFESLRWSHYYQVMMSAAGNLENAQELLVQAEDNGWSVSELRNHLKGKPKNEPSTPAEQAQDAQQEASEGDDSHDGEIVFQAVKTGSDLWRTPIGMIANLQDDAEYEVRIVRMS